MVAPGGTLSLITYQPIEWLHDRLRILDQTRLPTEENYNETTDYLEVADAIRTLKVRGAPAIGVAGAYGIALAAMAARAGSLDAFKSEVARAIQVIISTRPTARNLFWAAERMSGLLSRKKSVDVMRQLLVDSAVAIHRKEADSTRRLSELGSDIVSDGATVLTHCNTGPLATTGSGTALGIIIHGSQQGKRIRVLVDETRPLLQGARLTTWELQKAGIGFTLITDSMAGYYMARGDVDAVIVGADRIASNGDTANKIGTYGVAVLARAHLVPFYVAAPTSTIDMQLRSGEQIEIEQRSPEEVTHIGGVRIAPAGVDVGNPAFDVTPAKLITAIVTERGIIKRPFARQIKTIQTGRTA
jgi:methylthioribose-1-phosphate isomerase